MIRIAGGCIDSKEIGEHQVSLHHRLSFLGNEEKSKTNERSEPNDYLARISIPNVVLTSRLRFFSVKFRNYVRIALSKSTRYCLRISEILIKTQKKKQIES